MKYNPAIDGLRALAILPVMLFHAYPSYTPGGFIGVDVFFVISGFLISSLIFEGLVHKSFRISSFYAARVRRIFPALLVVLIFVLVTSWWLTFPNELMRVGQQVSASSAFAANIYLWSQAEYFSPAATTFPLLHLWSLGVEEQFYALWPLMIILLWRRAWTILPIVVLIGIASFAHAAWATDRSAAFFLPMSRAWELMLGAGLAWVMHTRARRFPAILFDVAAILGLGLILGSIVCVHETDPYPGWLTLAPTIGAGLVLWSGNTSRIVLPLLSSRPLVYVGRISYPLYMWHWPVLWVCATAWGVDATATRAVVAISISFALACLTFELIEKPVRYGTRWFAPAKAISLVAVIAILALLGQIFAINGFPGRWPSEVNTLLTYKFDDSIFRIGKCHLKPEQGPADFSNECFSGRTSGAKHVILWGDSAVTAIEPGLKQVAGGSLDIDELTTSNCPPFIGRYKPMTDRPHCSAINQFAFNHIKSSSPDVVIISFSPSYDTSLPDQAANTVRELRKFFHGTLVVVGPPPLWPKAFPETLLKTYLAAPSSGVPRNLSMPPDVAMASETVDDAVGTAVSAEGAIYLSAARQLCPQRQCLAMPDGEPAVFDRFHMTKGASVIVARAIQEAIRK
jgi:peptidoglycan/LPS O-acetylase OafA/YrhL